MVDEEKKEEIKEEPTEEPKEEPKEEVKPARDASQGDAGGEEVKTEEAAVEKKPVETPVQEKKEENPPAGGKPEPSGKFKDLIKEIEGLTTLELSELVKALEERFGVSANAPIAVADAPAASVGTAEVEEKTNFTVILADSGAQKIAVIKALREINQELGLKEAKDIADAPPKEILKDVSKEKAEEAKKKLETAGGKVELK